MDSPATASSTRPSASARTRALPTISTTSERTRAWFGSGRRPTRKQPRLPEARARCFASAKRKRCRTSARWPSIRRQRPGRRTTATSTSGWGTAAVSTMVRCPVRISPRRTPPSCGSIHSAVTATEDTAFRQTTRLWVSPVSCRKYGLTGCGIPSTSRSMQRGRCSSTTLARARSRRSTSAARGRTTAGGCGKGRSPPPLAPVRLRRTTGRCLPARRKPTVLSSIPWSSSTTNTPELSKKDTR